MAEGKRDEAVEALTQGLTTVSDVNKGKIPEEEGVPKAAEELRSVAAGLEQYMQNQRHLAEQLDKQELPGGSFPRGRNSSNQR